jgi:hypothetical protein
MSNWAEQTMARAIDLLVRQGRADLSADLQRLVELTNLDELDEFRLKEADDIAERFYTASTLAELSAVLKTVCSTFSFQHCSIHVIRENSGHTFAARIVTTFPSSWAKSYLDNFYEAIDPIMAHASQHMEGFYWSEVPVDAPIAREFMATAAKNGVGPSGYTNNVCTRGGDRIGVSLCSSEAPLDFYERFSTFAEDIVVLSEIAAEAFVRISVGDTDDFWEPTPDQLRLLRAIAVGATETEMKTIEFSYGSFTTIEQSVLQNFNARTLAEATVRAARMGFLNSTPLMRNEIYAPADDPAVAKKDNSKIRQMKRRNKPGRTRSRQPV